MGPFMIEQLTYQHARDLKERAAREALVRCHNRASGSASSLLSWLPWPGARLRGRRDAVRPLAPVVPLGGARRKDAVAPEREAS
jgi:hypothetical protein